MLCDFIIIFEIIHRMCNLQISIVLYYDVKEFYSHELYLTSIHLILLLGNERPQDCIYCMDGMEIVMFPIITISKGNLSTKHVYGVSKHHPSPILLLVFFE